MDGSKGRESVRQCQRCGRGFSGVSHNGRERRFCSKECAWSAQVKRPFATCRQCGRKYLTSRNSKGMFCSKECQWDSMRVSHESERGYAEAVRWMESLSRRMAREERTRTEIECEMCGARFVAKRSNARRCPACRRYLEYNHGDIRIYRNGRPDLSITLERLYVRDKGYCRGCGRHLEFVEDYNSDGYPSIDHIVPIAKGGTHTWDNVQLMCRGCNWRKRDALVPVASGLFQTRLPVG